MPYVTVGTENGAAIEVYYEDRGPHNIGWTHPDEVKTALLDFLAR